MKDIIYTVGMLIFSLSLVFGSCAYIAANTTGEILSYEQQMREDIKKAQALSAERAVRMEKKGVYDGITVEEYNLKFE